MKEQIDRGDEREMLTATIDLFLVFNATFSNISAIAWRPVLVVAQLVR
jgi:hypothetical protein